MVILKAFTTKLKYLPKIIPKSVKPMENIDDIKILQVTGLGGITGNNAQAEGYADQGQILSLIKWWIVHYVTALKRHWLTA